MPSSIYSKTNYSQPTQEINTPDTYCVIPKIAIHAIKALGAILMAAGIASIIAGFEVPLVALLVAGAAAIILGFALDKVKPEEIKPVLELPGPKGPDFWRPDESGPKDLGLADLDRVSNSAQAFGLELSSPNDPLSTPPIPFGNKTSIQHIGAPKEIPSLPANIQVDQQNSRDRICQPQAVLSQPIEIDTQYLTDLRDTDAAQGLVDFYKRLPKPQFNGPISDEPKDIQNWMKESLEVRNCKLLNLNKSNLKKLPKEIGLFVNLKTLNLNYNQIEKLPPAIGNLKSLTELNLSINSLEWLPTTIGNLRSLTKLNLSSNKLKALPVEIGNLRSLTELNLSGNALKNVPAQIGNLEPLTKLTLSYNKLKAIPVEIENLIFLTDLGLDSNELQVLPTEIGKLESLQNLNLSNNQLQALPAAEIGKIESLVNLNLSNNQLQAFELEINNLRSLISIGLTNNPLEAFPAQIGDFRDLSGRGYYYRYR